MSYEVLAHIYDDLMIDVPYHIWEQFFMKMVEETQDTELSQLKVLDIGCGTGKFLEFLCNTSISAVGMDISEEMLTIAQQRLGEKHGHCPLFLQSMTDFELEQLFDVITIFCDGINYLRDEASVRKTIGNVYEHLNPKGLFMFDVHSLLKMNTEFNNQTYSVLEEDYVVVWNTFLEPEHVVKHELTFFIKEEDGTYERVEESHVQKTFPLSDYIGFIEDAGFKVTHILNEHLEPDELNDSTRIFICAQKK